MNKGILASQIHFQRGATPLEYVFSYGETEAGVVLRKGAGKNVRWEVEDHPECFGPTREAAVTSYLSRELPSVITPVFSHRWVSTSNGPVGMRYYCGLTQETYNKVDDTAVFSQICQGCGETVSFHQEIATKLIYTRKEGEWLLHPRDVSV